MTCDTRVPTSSVWGECPTLPGGHDNTIPITAATTPVTLAEAARGPAESVPPITGDDCIAGSTRWSYQPCGEAPTTTTASYDIGTPPVLTTTVLSMPPVPPGGLPETGASLAGTASLALLFCVLGALARRKARR